MSLRTLVTGSDMCTASDGAGPSNAVGALVNQLLGGASKTQEQLRDVSLQHAPYLLSLRACKWHTDSVERLSCAAACAARPWQASAAAIQP